MLPRFGAHPLPSSSRTWPGYPTSLGHPAKLHVRGRSTRAGLAGARTRRRYRRSTPALLPGAPPFSAKARARRPSGAVSARPGHEDPRPSAPAILRAGVCGGRGCPRPRPIPTYRATGGTSTSRWKLRRREQARGPSNALQSLQMTTPFTFEDSRQDETHTAFFPFMSLVAARRTPLRMRRHPL